MQGLEIVMDIDTLEIYQVIDLDKVDIDETETSDSLEQSEVTAPEVFYQMNLFEAMNFANTS